MAATDIQENVLRSLYELQNNSKVFTTNKALYEKALEKYMVSVPVLLSLRIFHVDIRTPRGTPRRRTERGGDRAAGGGFALAGGKKLSHARFAPVHSRREGGREKARAQGRNGGMEGGRSYSTEG